MRNWHGNLSPFGKWHGPRRGVDDLSQVLALLFSADEPGFLFLASPETCFTDTAGTTQAEPGDPVALWLDQSGNDNHAEQATTANRPILGRKSKGFEGRRNLLNFTEELENSYWTKSNITVSSEGDGVSRITANAGTGIRTGLRRTSFVNDGNRLLSIEILPDGVSKVILSFASDTTAIGAVAGSILVDLESVSILDTGSTSTNQSAELLSDGYIRIVLDHDSTGSSSNSRFRVQICPPDATNLSEAVENWDPTGSESMLVRRIQVERGSSPSPYQRVGNNFDITEPGKPDRYYLFFGGSSDPRWMQTPTITPGTDKVQVFAGVRKLSDAATGMVLNSGDIGSLGVGSVNLFAPAGNGVDAYRFSMSGTSRVVLNILGFDAPISTVLSGQGDISAPSLSFFVNGALEGISTDSLGSGDFAANQANIGRRAPDNDLFFNGEISALTTRFGPNLDANQIELVERFTADKVPELTKPVIDGVPTIGVS